MCNDCIFVKVDGIWTNDVKRVDAYLFDLASDMNIVILDAEGEPEGGEGSSNDKGKGGGRVGMEGVGGGVREMRRGQQGGRRRGGRSRWEGHRGWYGGVGGGEGRG